MLAPSSRWSRRVALHASYLLGALIVCAVFLREPGFEYPKASFTKTMEGTADRPFAYRVLVPLLVRGVRAAIPADARVAFADRIRPNTLGKLISDCGVDVRYAVEFLIASALMFGALYGFLLVTRRLFANLYPSDDGACDVVPFVALLLLPACFCWGSYVYDFPELLFLATGMLLLVRERWAPFLLVYLVACLNKETTAFLTVIYALYFARRLPWRRYLALGAAQVGIFALVKVGLAYAFRGNPGSLVADQLGRNADLVFRGPWSLPTITALFVLFLVLSWRWRENHPFLKAAVWVLVPVVVLTFAFGQVDEIRNYYGALPVVVLLASRTAAASMGLRLGTNDRDASTPGVQEIAATVRLTRP